MSKECYYAYTDGSCLKNPDGEGGWACIVFDEFGNPTKCSGYSPSTTNQRMELLAVIKATRLVPDGCPIKIFSDSAYVCNSMSKGWLSGWVKNGWKTSSGAPVANKDLWMLMLEAIEKHDITMVWVKGHASNIFNNECDKMARDISTFTNTTKTAYSKYIADMRSN